MRLLSKLIFILLPLTVFAQEQVLTIKDFKGLDTRTGTFQLAPNQLIKAHNIDFPTNGVIGVRRGYDSISVVTGQDSLVDNGLYAAYYSDGGQQLMAVCDSNGVGYGGVYVTPLGSVNFADSATKIVNFWPVTRSAAFTQYQNDVYVMNGASGGGVYVNNSHEFRRWPVQPPGSPLVVPLNVSGNLNGEYRYHIYAGQTGDLIDPTITTRAMLDSNISLDLDGYLTAPVKVSNGKILLTDFQPLRSDSLHHTDRRNAIFTVTSVQNTTLYWIKINSDSVGYTSDGTATNTEIVSNLVDSINNSSPGMGDSVTAAVKKGPKVWAYSVGNTVDFTMDCSANLLLDSTYYNIVILRSIADIGSPDKADSVFPITTLAIYDTTVIDTLTYTDNNADNPGVYFTALFNDSRVGRDSLGYMSSRYGAPGFVASGVITGADTSKHGIYAGWIDTDTTSLHGMAYACTFIDTITGIESDTGRSLFIYNDSADMKTYRKYTISIPKPLSTDSSFKVNIYRAPIFILGEFDSSRALVYDTTTTNNIEVNVGGFDHVSDTVLNGGGPNTETIIYFGGPFYRINAGNHTGKANPVQLPGSQFLVGAYRWVGQADISDSIFTDSLRYDSVLYQPLIYSPYDKVTIPFLAKNVFSFHNRLWFTYESRLYYSNLDLQLLNLNKHKFGDLEFVPITENDGDEITYAYPEKDYIVVYKNHSTHIVYEKDLDGMFTYNVNGVFFASVQISDYGGLVAPRSFVHTPFANLYMSQEGVNIQTLSKTLDQTHDKSILSANLINFDSLSLKVKARTEGFYAPREQKAMFSVGDTTYVYDFRSGAWFTWDRLFNAAALYGKENNVQFTPGDTMYFAQGGSSNIYRFGTSSNDNGDTIVTVWQFPPLFPDYHKRAISRVGIWSDGSNSTANDLCVWDYNEEDSLLDSSLYGGLNAHRYSLSGFPGKTGLFHSLKFGSASGLSLSNQTFDRIDIFYTNNGMDEGK